MPPAPLAHARISATAASDVVQIKREHLHQRQRRTVCGDCEAASSTTRQLPTDQEALPLR